MSNARHRLEIVYSRAHADEYLRQGWKLLSEFREEGAEEPYLYILEWQHDSRPAPVVSPPKHTTS